ncbi:TerB family tellurite resistance protein [Alphaproteobacteria bacterium KMM 3653]|uniref:TerB family tellurite resistance protein n=1 Tax=Harenicola maris TaxID=2841044 RepID=A0AAP2CTG9_9RHOB|nr:TerB family tellurite resistance protein [Harenicola maris]
MIAEFFQRLTGHTPEAPLPELDARLALGALLVRLAKSDHLYSVEEISKIDVILANRYALNPVEAAKMRATCEKLEAQAPDTQSFTEQVQAGVSHAERLAVFDTLWQVSMADGRLRAEEDKVLRFVGTALGLSQEDAAGVAALHQPRNDA